MSFGEYFVTGLKMYLVQLITSIILGILAFLAIGVLGLGWFKANFAFLVIGYLILIALGIFTSGFFAQTIWDWD